jgi:hypothetical protein
MRFTLIHLVSIKERGARDAKQDAVSNWSQGFIKLLREAKHSPRYSMIGLRNLAKAVHDP